jgi:hypothetical protein
VDSYSYGLEYGSHPWQELLLPQADILLPHGHAVNVKNLAHSSPKP